jgi:hypothetical protein
MTQFRKFVRFSLRTRPSYLQPVYWNRGVSEKDYQVTAGNVGYTPPENNCQGSGILWPDIRDRTKLADEFVWLSRTRNAGRTASALSQSVCDDIINHSKEWINNLESRIHEKDVDTKRAAWEWQHYLHQDKPLSQFRGPLCSRGSRKGLEALGLLDWDSFNIMSQRSQARHRNETWWGLAAMAMGIASGTHSRLAGLTWQHPASTKPYRSIAEFCKYIG